MPLYEYHCENCNADFEALVSFKNADKQKCIVCGSPKVKRANSTFASNLGPVANAGTVSRRPERSDSGCSTGG